MEQILDFDTDLLLYFNGLHTPFWDTVMVYSTDQKSWIWLFLTIIGAVVYNKRKDSLWTLIPIIILVVIADHTASSLFKPVFERLRPCHNTEIQSLIYMPQGFGCGGKYGFFSSHAANSFAIAFFIFLTLKPRYKWWSLPLFIWAVLFSISRVYLAKHYPSDILVGAIAGVLIAWGVFKVSAWAKIKYSSQS